MTAETGAMMAQSPFARMYPDVDWRALFGKMGAMLREDFDWSDEIRALTQPTMLVFADADSIPTSHIAEFYALLGGGQRDAGLDGSGRPRGRLAIVPDKTHYSMFSDDAVARLVVPFLDAPMPSQEASLPARPRVNADPAQ